MGMLRNSVDTSTLSTPQVPNSHHCFFMKLRKYSLYIQLNGGKATGALLTWMEKKKDAAGFLVSGSADQSFAISEF